MIARAVALTLVLFASTAMAQDDPDGGTTNSRATEFRAMHGPAQEAIPGGPLLIGAYAVAWLLLMGYLVHLGRLSARTQEDVTRLLLAVEKKRDDKKGA